MIRILTLFLYLYTTKIAATAGKPEEKKEEKKEKPKEEEVDPLEGGMDMFGGGGGGGDY